MHALLNPVIICSGSDFYGYTHIWGSPLLLTWFKFNPHKDK